jgi:hypothetical protein
MTTMNEVFMVIFVACLTRLCHSSHPLPKTNGVTHQSVANDNTDDATHGLTAAGFTVVRATCDIAAAPLL